jgi:drug/metabolite transporter (DMT)-like permease
MPRDLGQRSSISWAIAVGAAIATYSVLDAAAVGRLADAAAGPAAAPAYLAVTLFLQGFFIAVATAVRGGAERVRRGWRTARRTGVLVGLGVVAAYLLVLLAFQRADAGRVATLRESSVLLAVALTRGVRPPMVWAGAALVVLVAVLVVV